MVEIPNIRCFVRCLVVANRAFTFSTQEKSFGVEVIEWLQNTTRRVYVGGRQRLLQVMLIPDRILPVRVFREACRQDLSVIEKDNFRLLRAAMYNSLRNNNPRSRLDDTQNFVLGRSCDERTFSINGQAVDLIDVTVDDFQDIAAVEGRRRNVPTNYQVVESRAEQNIFR